MIYFDSRFTRTSGSFIGASTSVRGTKN